MFSVRINGHNPFGPNMKFADFKRLNRRQVNSANKAASSANGEKSADGHFSSNSSGGSSSAFDDSLIENEIGTAPPEKQGKTKM